MISKLPRLFLKLVVLLMPCIISANTNLVVFNENVLLLQNTKLYLGETLVSQDFQSGPNPLRKAFFKQKSKNKKITAAVLAFPLPFGIVGLHRIYLGCEPFIPVVYIASLGGAFGILPLIDFLVILKEQDLSKFNNSNQVFMWVDH